MKITRTITHSKPWKLLRLLYEVQRREGVPFLCLELLSFVVIRNPLARSLMGLHPSVCNAFFVFYCRLSAIFYWVARRTGDGQFSDADRYKIIWVNPRTIEYQLTYGEDGPRITQRHGRVLGGDWDDKTQPLELNDRFSEWNDFHKAPYLDEEEPITDLYFRLKDEGYLSQQELIREDPKAAVEASGGAPHPRLNEIGVNIARDGTLIWRCYGQHRMLLSKILSLDRVPVQVLVRHREWQNVRDRIKNGGEVPPSLATHPDLQDLP